MRGQDMGALGLDDLSATVVDVGGGVQAEAAVPVLGVASGKKSWRQAQDPPAFRADVAAAADSGNSPSRHNGTYDSSSPDQWPYRVRRRTSKVTDNTQRSYGTDRAMSM